MAIAYVLADPTFSSLKVTVQVVDSTGTVQKTLLNRVTQGLGAQSVTWDGTDGETPPKLLPIGTYTVEVEAADSSNLSSPWTRTSLSPGRHSQTSYTYDRLDELLSASGPSDPVQYTYDPAGNRLTRSTRRPLWKPHSL